MKKDARTKQAERIIEIIESDLQKGKSVLPPWRKTWGGIHLMPQNIRGNRYRGSNLMMLSMAPYGMPFYLTYNQALERGGVVIEGEKGWPVVFWKFFDKEKDKNGKEKQRPPVCFGSTVFNIEQCRKITLEDLRKIQKQTDSNHGRIAASAKRKIEKLGVDADVEKLGKKWDKFAEQCAKKTQGPKHEHNPIKSAEKIHSKYRKIGGPEVKHGGNRACYFPTKDEIRIPLLTSFETAEEYHSTRFHEEVHSTGHKDRLDRKELNEHLMFGDHMYSREELTAEFGASMLASVCGFAPKVEDNSASYIRHWLKKLKDDPSILYEAARDAQKATDLILDVKFSQEGIKEGGKPMRQDAFESHA